MTDYLVTGPGGKQYKVSGQGSREDALAEVQKRYGGGFQPQDKPLMPEQSTGGGILSRAGALLKDAGLSAVEGAAGAGGDLYNGLYQGTKWLADKTGMPGFVQRGITEDYKANPRPTLPGYGPLPTSQEVRERFSDPVFGPRNFKPQNEFEDWAHTAATFAPGLLTGPQGIVRNLATSVVAPTVGTEMGGKVAEAAGYDQSTGRLIGGLAGGFAEPGAALTFGHGAAMPERQTLLHLLDREGIETTGGQATGNTALKRTEQQGYGPMIAGLQDRQGRQFNRSVLRLIGEDAEMATPDVMNAANERIGGEFERLAAGTNVPMTKQVEDDILAAGAQYEDMTAPANRPPVVLSTIRHLADEAARNGGVIPGELYASIRSDLGRKARAATDPQLQEVLRGIQNAMDDGMQAAMPPQLQEAWANARRQYRNYIPIERAMGAPGSNAALGYISPQGLRSATVNEQGLRNYVTGEGDLQELARAGAGILEKPSDSGTAANLKALVGRGVGGGGIGTTLAAAGHPFMGLTAAAVGMLPELRSTLAGFLAPAISEQARGISPFAQVNPATPLLSPMAARRDN